MGFTGEHCHGQAIIIHQCSAQQEAQPHQQFLQISPVIIIWSWPRIQEKKVLTVSIQITHNDPPRSLHASRKILAPVIKLKTLSLRGIAKQCLVEELLQERHCPEWEHGHYHCIGMLVEAIPLWIAFGCLRYAWQRQPGGIISSLWSLVILL